MNDNRADKPTSHTKNCCSSRDKSQISKVVRIRSLPRQNGTNNFSQKRTLNFTKSGMDQQQVGAVLGTKART